MADKVCCPGPLSNQGGATASGGAFREAVCVHTSKVYDSCRSKECLRDIRVYLTREAQDMLNSGGIASVKPRAADLLCVKIDVEPVQFNRGLYSVDSRFFYRIECEVSCVSSTVWPCLTSALCCSAARAAHASSPRAISRTARTYSCAQTATARQPS